MPSFDCFVLSKNMLVPLTLPWALLCFIVLLGCMLKFPLEFFHFTFVERDISTVIRILECYYWNKKILILVFLIWSFLV
jgi:hypothetical protein